MSFITAIFIFVLVWWIVIFTALPWGNAPHHAPEIGHDRGAPANPRLKKKLLWTTAISALITVFIYLTVYYTGFSLHNWVKAWSETH